MKTLSCMLMLGLLLSPVAMASPEKEPHITTKDLDKVPMPLYHITMQCPTGITADMSSYYPDTMLKLMEAYTGAISPQVFLAWMNTYHPAAYFGTKGWISKCLGVEVDG